VAEINYLSLFKILKRSKDWIIGFSKYVRNPNINFSPSRLTIARIILTITSERKTNANSINELSARLSSASH
jgi:hypothetical protein